MSVRTIKVGGLVIGCDNSKMGSVMHVNLPPPETCSPSAPCMGDGCYAMKFRRLRPAVARAQDANWLALLSDREGYFETIEDVVRCYRPALFRWHSAGDIPDADYYARMRGLAQRRPYVRFLVFTKKYDIVMEEANRPDNLAVMLSAWPGLALPEAAQTRYPVAWMRDTRRGRTADPRIPAAAFECGGGCDKCQLCWGMRPGQSVVFNRH